MPPLIPALWVRRALKPRVAPDPPQFTTEPPRYAGVPKPHSSGTTPAPGWVCRFLSSRLLMCRSQE
jgi:hypothetical protein